MRMAPKRPQAAMPRAADPMNPRALGVQGATGGPKPAPQVMPMPRDADVTPRSLDLAAEGARRAAAAAAAAGGTRPPVGGMRPQGPAPTGPMVPVRGGGMAPASVATMMKKGGKVKSKQTTKMVSGGKVSSASKRADGCAVKGKTKGRMV